MIAKNSSASDHTEQYGAQNEAERYTLIGWCVIVLVMNITGNSIILLSTIRYRALRLDRVSILLIQNIAVSDLLVAVFGVHPTLVSLMRSKWPYGTFLCGMFASLDNICKISGVLLICGMHITKLLSLIYPLHSIGRTNRSGYLICTAMWLLSTVVAITNIIVDNGKDSFYFDYRIYKCRYSLSATVWKWLVPVTGTVLNVVPNIIVICTTIALLSVVRRATGRINRQGILTAVYVGFVYCISFLPLALYLTVYLQIKSNLNYIISPGLKNFLEFTVYKFVFFVVYVNGISNIFIYYFSINSFKSFLRKAMFYYFQRLTSWCRFGQSESFEMQNFRRP